MYFSCFFPGNFFSPASLSRNSSQFLWTLILCSISAIYQRWRYWQNWQSIHCHFWIKECIFQQYLNICFKVYQKNSCIFCWIIFVFNRSGVCLKNAFCKMCVTICGRFRLAEDIVVGLQQQKNSSQREKISYICGLRARIECEPVSEHSTRSDRVTNIGYLLPLGASVD